MMKVKEEFDYESLARKLESQVDNLTKEIDRQQKLRDNYIGQMEKKLKECQLSFVEAEKSLIARSEVVSLLAILTPVFIVAIFLKYLKIKIVRSINESFHFGAYKNHVLPWFYVCLYMSMYLCRYICMCVCVYMYISTHVYVTFLQILEKDNARLEVEMKAVSNELDHQKDCNRFLREEMTRLEMSIEQYKVLSLTKVYSIFGASLKLQCCFLVFRLTELR